MLTEAGIEGDLRDKLLAECAETATKLDNVLVEKKDEENNYDFFWKNAKLCTLFTHFRRNRHGTQQKILKK